MAFAVSTVVTNKGKAFFADRLQTTPGTYTTSPHFGRCGTGATAAARSAVASDTALSTSALSGSGSESVLTTTQTNDTYQVQVTLTAAGNLSVDEFGLFDAGTLGNMFLSATHNVISLASGDSIAYTAKTQVT